LDLKDILVNHFDCILPFFFLLCFILFSKELTWFFTFIITFLAHNQKKNVLYSRDNVHNVAIELLIGMIKSEVLIPISKDYFIYSGVSIVHHVTGVFHHVLLLVDQ